MQLKVLKLKMKSPEEFFMKYAFPCAHVLLQAGTITQEQHDELGKAVLENKFPSREKIESYFVAAFRRIRNLAKEMNIEDYWDMKVLKEYWHNNHNKMIEQGEGNYSKFPESFCDFCKTHVAEIFARPIDLGLGSIHSCNIMSECGYQMT